MKAEFDKIANQYDDWHGQLIRGSGFDREYFNAYKIKEARRLLGDKQPKAILDFGCGVGDVSVHMHRFFPSAQIYGVDISEASVEIAKEKQQHLPATYAPLGEDWEHTVGSFGCKFDLIFIIGVFHHAPREQHQAILSAITPHMQKGAALFIFELNPYNPATRYVFNKYEKPVDANANLIKPNYLKKIIKINNLNLINCHYTIFFPKPLSLLLPLEQYLRFLPMGAHYYLFTEAK